MDSLKGDSWTAKAKAHIDPSIRTMGTPANKENPNENRTSSRGIVTCYGCGKAGHYAQDCQVKEQIRVNIPSQAKKGVASRQIECMNVDESKTTTADECRTADTSMEEEDSEVCFIDTHMEPRDKFQRAVQLHVGKRQLSNQWFDSRIDSG